MTRTLTIERPAPLDAARPRSFGPIVLAPGHGRGPTRLAAFEAALRDAGVANYNLICLSSVIPPRVHIERRRWHTPAHEWGRRLYCVLSEAREDRPGHAVHAGIGWVRDPAAAWRSARCRPRSPARAARTSRCAPS